MKRFPSILLLTFIISVTISQNSPTLLWTKTIYDQPIGNKPLSICIVNDGIIYVANYAGSYRDAEIGFFVQKYNASGDVLWRYSHINKYPDNFLAIDATCDENGNTYVSTDHNKIWKIAPDGDSLWMKDASFMHNGVLYPEQGNYLNFKNGKVTACGWHGLYTYDQNGNFTDLLYEEQKMRDPSYDGLGNTYFIGDYVPIIDHEHRIVKLNKNHNKVWKILLEPLKNVSQNDGIDADIYGNVFLLSAYSTGSKLTKYDTDGHLLWKIDVPVNTYHPHNLYNARIDGSLYADREGNVFVAGDVSDTSGVKFVLCKYSSSGNLIWKFEQDPDLSFTNIFTTNIINVGPDLYICGYKTTEAEFRPPGFMMKLSDPDNLSSVEESEPISDSWQLYPNPSTGNMSIYCQHNITPINKITFEVTTVTGARISPPIAQRDAQTWSMDLSNIQAGCYFLRVRDGDNVAVKRILTVK
jgi:hypothetical protein